MNVTVTNLCKASKATPLIREAASSPMRSQYKKMHRLADSESDSRGSQAANAVCR